MKTLTNIALLSLLLIISNTYGQDYIVHVKGDTIQGELKPMTFGTEEKVQIRTADKQKKIYTIFQVKAYRYKGEIYHPIRKDNGYTFMKLIKPGYLSLYAFQRENETLFDGQYLAKKDGTSLEVPNLMFKKILAKYLDDCDDVSGKIDAGDYGKKDLEKIIDEYNLCIETRTTTYDRAVVQQKEQSATITAWDVLEKEVKSKSDFNGKADALEMIAEIKTKIRRQEKVPNFMVEGLKNSLSQADLDTELKNALAELPQ